MRRLNRYYNEAVVNNNKNENLSSSDSQLSSISSSENTLKDALVKIKHYYFVEACYLNKKKLLYLCIPIYFLLKLIQKRG